MDFNLINVGIADIQVAQAPDILRTILGSCVGVCLYDQIKKIGGMSHVMLPSHRKSSVSKMKYADTAIPMLVDDLEEQGADQRRLIAKIVGGATMFDVGEGSLMGEIGRNNINKVKEVLGGMNIQIISEDIGGDYGRTIDFYMESGDVKIKSMTGDEKII